MANRPKGDTNSADKDGRGLLDRLFGKKNLHDKQAPDEGVHRRPDESPSVTGDAKSFQPGTSREPHMATVEEDTEAGDTEFLNQKPGFGDGDANVEDPDGGDEPEEPRPTEPDGAARGGPPAEEPSSGDIDLPPAELRAATPLPEEPSPAADAALTAPVAATGPDVPPPGEPEAPRRGLFGRLASGLSKSSARLGAGIADAFVQKRELTEEVLELLEDQLIAADLGLPATGRVIERLRAQRFKTDLTLSDVRGILADEIVETLAPLEAPLEIDARHAPHVILVAGVNGAGKTTTIGKLASQLRGQGHSVLMAAGDTFRAAAIEQLEIWGARTGTPVMTRPQGADAAGLAFDAIERARAEKIDVVLIDTAGRLQNRTELMDELGKIVRVMRKVDRTAPHDSLLVLDATVGQNALRQAEAFMETAGVSGLVMTKLDGTARGGVLVALGDRFGLPIHYVGVGEGVDDLQTFDARAFARALTAETKG